MLVELLEIPGGSSTTTLVFAVFGKPVLPAASFHILNGLSLQENAEVYGWVTIAMSSFTPPPLTVDQ